ncbi:MAG TPA: BamA/TamA family outer membrane protein [Anaeromyxobacter sp.]|nr:BamA/TamA family outer membrane protein [Anaeromyxobacter sp.]
MRRPIAAAALALSLGSAGCVHGRGTQQEPLVDEVIFRGVNSVDEDELAEGLATRAPITRGGFLGNVIQDRQRFDPDALPTDVERIEAFYRDRGYYGVAVEEPDVEGAGAGLVKVTFRVSEGRPALVTKLEIDGLDAAPDAARRIGKLPLRVGDVFKVSDYDAAREALTAALRNNGWATAEVTQSAVVVPQEAAAEVRYEVKPGIRYRVGPIFVGRVAGISSRKIQDQVSAVLRTGEWWDESRLAAARRRIADLGVFGAVRVTRAEPDMQRGTVAVVIDLRQAKYQTVRAGPGLAFDPTRWDAEASVSWQHRNFMGDLRRLTLDLRAGYAWVPTPFAPRKRGPVAKLTADFSQPGAFTRWVDAAVRAEVERGIEDAYDYVAERLRLGLPLRIVSRLALVPSLNFEVYQLSNTATDFDPTKPVPPDSTEPVLANCQLQTNLCLLTYLEQLLAWDARDNPLNTRSGWYAGLTLQEGLGMGGYGYRYLRLEPEFRAFYPVGRRAVLALRARIGAIIPVNEADPPPVVARFNAGGPLSMRGYYTDRLSPMVLQEGEWVSVGGNGVADGSVELRFDVAGALGGALFVDAAGISNYSSKPTEYQTALDPTLLQWGAGLGLRYRTPFGPLRVDIGMRLPTDLSKGVPFDDRFPAVPYAIGADGLPATHREPIVAVQIALGEAF